MDEHSDEPQSTLRHIIDAIPQQIWSGPPDGTLDFCNARWRDEKGLTLAQLQGNGWQAMLHPDDAARVRTAWRHSVETGEPYEQEERHRMADGTFRWFLARGLPHRGPDGRIRRWHGSNTDISELKATQEALERSRASLAEAQRLSRTGSFCWTPARHRLEWSAEASRILGYEPSVLPTLDRVVDRTHPDDLDTVLRLAAVDEEAKEFTAAFRLLMPDGSPKHLELAARTRRNAEGEIEMVGAFTDVTVMCMALLEIEALKDRLHRENLALKEEISHVSQFEEVIGSSAALRSVLANVAKVAPTDSTVLIVGESGTGKELLARAIHKRSQRAQSPFVAVNCAATPTALIASDLFGHEKGAFTGATQRRLGRFEQAHGGTIFLDEVGDLPMDAQLALLRVLQERQFERVGGSQMLSANVRVIAATHRNLNEAVVAGRFRADLYYRLNVFPLQIPPLRERPEDIPHLLSYFCRSFANRAHKSFKGVSTRAHSLFLRYSWPGNVRELQNVVERGVILCDSDVFDIDESWLQSPPTASARPDGTSLLTELAETEAALIEKALQECQGRVAGPRGAAARLGIPRSSLESRIKKLGLQKSRYKP